MTRTVVQRILAVCSLLGVSTLLVLVSAGSASADTPEPRPGSWEPKPDIDVLHAFLVLGGIPLLAFAVITMLFVAPALAKGENLSPTALTPENQWIGGPRKKAGELAAPDSDSSKAGGAGGQW